MKWAVEAEETTCGPGSTLVATRNVREWLPGALERLGDQLDVIVYGFERSA